MKTLQPAKDDLLSSKKAETIACAKRHVTLLRKLNYITKLVGSSPRDVDSWITLSAPPSEQDSLFFDENDIQKGRHFREDSLPIPPTPPLSGPPSATLPHSSSSSSHVPSPLSPGAEFSSKSAAEQVIKAGAGSNKDGLAPLKIAPPITHTPPRSPNSSPKSDDESTTKPSSASLTKSASKAHPVVNGTTKVTSEGHQPEGVQEQSKNRANGVESGRQDQDGAAPVADASSPSSSTAGAQSTFTPKALHHSPDTSPEAESIPEPQHSMTESSQKSSDGQDDKEMDASPDSQLRMEEAQANSAADAKDALRNPPLSLGMPPPLTPKKSPTRTEKIDGAMDIDTRSAEQQLADVEMTDASPSKQDTQDKKTVPTPDLTPGRMTTRVASGAIRQKSVSEILGEAPKQSPHGLPSPISRRNTSLQTPQTPDGFDRSRMSTVVFSKDRDPTSTKALHSELDGYLALKGASLDPEKDYLRPLFLHQAWGPPRAEYLHDLLIQTKKTVTSADIYASMREQIDYRILRRIYQLQNANRWSLRQLAKFQDPDPQPCHLDFMLDEMKWLRTDFKQERKWKQILARNCAEWCAEYVAASPAKQERLRIKTKPREELVESPPELIPSGSTGTSEASEEDVPVSLITSTPPMALFSLGYNDLVFQIDSTPSGDALLAELPQYDPKASRRPTDSALPITKGDNMSAVSKMVTKKLVPKIMGHPRKRSRYEFDQSDDDAVPKHKRTKSSDPSPFLSPARRSSPRSEIPPEEQEVSLFNPINKHILDRLRANHAFRPPSEFPMPSLDFFESRPPSQWTWDEDQRLRHCVRKYSFNWSLIAMDLQAQCQPSKQTSGPERRTPWECFERWSQLEGLPNDMSKTPYFKTYQNRLDAANRVLQAQAATAAQQAQSTGTPTSAIRRRTSCQPVRVDRRRDTRHVTMIDAIRKLARKRENAIARQAEAQKAAAMRKSHAEPNQNARNPTMTPQEYSKRRHDVEAENKRRQELARKQKQLAEQQHKMQQQQQQRQLSNSQMPMNPQQQQAMAAAQQQIRLQTPTQAPSTPQISTAQPNQPRIAAPTGGLQNPNVAAALGLGMTSQQAQQLQALRAAGKLPTNVEFAQLAALQQQRQLLAQAQAQGQLQNGQNPGLAAAHLSPSANGMQPTQQQMLAALQQRAAAANIANLNNLGVNSMGMVNGSPSSHAPGNHMTQIPQLNSNAAAAAIMSMQQQIMAANPHISSDHARTVAQERLKQQIRQSAVAAASGTGVGMQGLASFANGAGVNNLTQQQAALAQQHLSMGQQASANHSQMMAAFAAGGFAHQNPAATMQHMGMNGLAGLSGLVNGGSGSPTQAQQQIYRGMNLNLSGLTPAQAQQLVQHQQQVQAQAQMQAQANRLSSGSPGLVPVRPDSRAGTATPVMGGALPTTSAPGGTGAGAMGRSASLSSVGGTPAARNGGGSAAGSPVIGTPVQSLAK